MNNDHEGRTFQLGPINQYKTTFKICATTWRHHQVISEQRVTKVLSGEITVLDGQAGPTLYKCYTNVLGLLGAYAHASALIATYKHCLNTVEISYLIRAFPPRFVNSGLMTYYCENHIRVSWTYQHCIGTTWVHRY